MRVVYCILIFTILLINNSLYGVDVSVEKNLILGDTKKISNKEDFTPEQPTQQYNDLGPVINFTKTDVNCYGDNTGTIELTVTGSTGAVTFSWDDGSTAQNRTNLGAGNYSVSVTDSNGTTAQSITITQPVAALSVVLTETNVLCFGDATGTATAVPSGGTGPYSYSWNTAPAQTTATAAGLAAGSYIVNVTDANGCATTSNVTITQPSAAMNVATSQTNVLCFGASTGTATAAPSGGTGPYSYSWNTTPAQTTATATGLAAGSYSVTVTDASGCTSTSNVTITQPSAALIVTTSQTNILCFGAATGTATATPSGGTGSYSYSWNTAPAQTTATATGLAAGSYIVNVTDANGCPATGNVTITQPPLLTISSISSNTPMCEGSNLNLSVMPIGGTLPYTYSWAGPNSYSSTNQNPVLNNVLLNASGTYNVNVSDANSCTVSSSTLVVINPTPIVIAAPASQSLCSGAVTSISLTGNVSGTIFIWTASVSSGSVTGYSNGSGNNIAQTLVNSTAAPATVTYTITPSANGCTGSAIIVVVTVNPAPVITATPVIQTICTGGATSISLASTINGTNFVWTSALTSGIATGFSNGSGNTITQTLANSSTTQATVTYTITPTANGCAGTPITADVVVNPNATITLTSAPGTKAQTICINTPLSNITYAIGGSGTGAVISSGALPAGTTGNFAGGIFTISGTPTVAGTFLYSITTTGPCVQVTASGTITSYPIPTISPITDHLYCTGITTSAITISGPVPGTIFSWTNNNSAIGLGISGTGNIPPFLTTNNTTDPISATITVTPNANGCAGTPIIFQITVNPAPVLNTAITGSVCSGNIFSYIPGSLTTATSFGWTRAAVAGISNSAASGTGNISETLNNVTSNAIVVTYVYDLTANGCSNNQTLNVTVVPIPTLTSSLNPAAICSNTSFNYTPFFSIAGTVATWSRAAISGISNPVGTGGSSITETLINTTTNNVDVVYVFSLNAGGCTNTQNVTVRIKPTPSLTSGLLSPAICSNTVYSYIPTSGTSGVAFMWNRTLVAGITPAAGSGLNNPNEILVNSTPNPVNVTYVYTLAGAGCTNIQNVVVPVSPVPTLSSTTTPSAICSNTLFSYTPTSATAGTTFNWNRALIAGISNPAGSGTDNPNEVLINNTTGSIDVTYIYTLNSAGCTHIQNIVVKVNPIPTLTSILLPPSICSNTIFSYTPVSGAAGTTFSWSRASVAGISNPATNGTGNPNETLINTSPNPLNVIYTYTLATVNCSNPVTYDVQVTVNPRPTLTSILTPPAICNNTLFSYTPTSGLSGTIFSWTRAAVGGLTNPASSGTGDPSEILINNSATPVSVTYVYSLAANGCNNPTLYNVVVTVNPTPTFTSTLSPPAICSNTLFSYIPASGTAGTTFAWSRAAVTGITNPATSGTGNPNETLTNTTSSPLIVNYNYTTSASGCTSPSNFNVSVTVNPQPLLTSTLTPPAICSNTQFSYTPTSSSSGILFNWSRAAISNISNPASSGTGDPSETLFNTSALPVSVTYVYTMSGNGCNGITSYNVVVVVNPIASLTSTLNPPTICGNSVFNYTPTSNTPGATFNWSRNLVAGISNPAASGTDNPNENLVNTTNVPVLVSYVYTLSGGGCSNPSPNSVVVTVNPNPTISSSLTPPAICSNTAFFYTPASNTPGTSFAWSRAAVAGISNSSATGTGNPNEILINTTIDPVNVVYKYTLTANSCTNLTTYDVVVQVKPRPILTSTLTPPSVCSNSLFSYTPTSSTAGAQFVWNRAAVAGISNAAASGTGDPNENLVNLTNAPINITYVYQLSISGCTNPTSFFVTVTVNPVPVLTSTLTPPDICSNSTISYNPTSFTGGATFAWSRVAIAGITNPAATGSNNPMENLVNTTNSPISVSYVYTVSANGCSNPSTYNVTLMVNPVPNLTSTLTPPAICSNTVFSYIPSSDILGTTFSWTRASVAGISNASSSGTDNPNETLVNTTNAPKSVTYIYSLSKGSCINTSTYNVTVVVNPVPSLSSSLVPPGICSNNLFSYIPTSSTAGATFNWNRAAIAGISNTAASGVDNPNETLINTTTSPINVQYSYALSANGCVNSQSVNVIVTPVPVLTSTLAPADICSNTLFSYIPTSTINPTTFSWSRAAVVGISNPVSAGTGNISETLINTTGSPVSVTYIYTLTASGCLNPTTYSIVVKVISSPVLTSSANPPAICSGSVFSYSPTSSTSGITFNWTRATVAGITNPAGSGIGNPNESLTNTTSATVNVTYVYALNIAGCSPAPVFNVIVQVKPTPFLSSSLTPTGICSNTLFSYNPTSATAGTTFAWSRAVVAGISNPIASGTDNPGEYLDNTTTNPIDVIYIYTLTANGCLNTQSVTVKVTPMPSLTSAINPPNVCSTHPFTYTPTSNVGGITFNWSRAAVAGISNPAASGTGAINENLINTTLSSVLVTYVYTMSLNGCTNTANIQVLVVPAPPVSASASDVSVCAGSTHDLFSSTTVALQTLTPLDETFESASSMVAANASTGGTTTAPAWTIHQSVYNPGDAISSPGASHFYLSDSRAQGNGTTLTSTTLRTPVLNTTGYSALTLSFWHYFNASGATAEVRYSTNGSTWTTIGTPYTTNQGTSGGFVNQIIDLTPYINNPTFYIQFYYHSASRARYWAIDNVNITGTVAPTISWTSVPAGFTSNIANPTGITLTQTTTYTATYSYPGFTCTGQASVTVNKLNDDEPPVIINVPPDVTFECGDCIQAFVNADFEGNPSITTWAYIKSIPGNQGVPGWYTTAPSGNMEIQHTGCVACGSPVSYNGNYHAELNSDGVGDFYQQFCTVPTTTVQVIFHHMKRVPPTPNGLPDVMAVYTGPDLAHLTKVYTASTTSTTTWTTNIVNVPIPVGQISTIFLFRAISTSSGDLTYGNLIDGIQAVTLFNSFLLPSATDNCPGVDLSVSEVKTPGTCSSNYTLLRTWTATDASGNKTYAHQTVTVGDFIAPVLHGIPADITISCETPIPALPNVTATDNCVVPVVTYLGEVKTAGSCPNNYTLTRSWKATDFCNNTTTGSYKITVRDITAPVITLPPPILISCGTSILPTFTGMATVTDNCDPNPSLTWSDTTTPGTCPGNFEINRTWVATDQCGNSTTAVQAIVLQDISVRDTTPPVITLPAAFPVNCGAPTSPADIGWATATDNCDPNPVLTFSDVSSPGSCTGRSQIIRTWTAVDACGNIRHTPQTINIQDIIAPTITIPANITISCDASRLPAATGGNATAVDNCDPIPVITYSDVTNAGACAGANVILRTWKATDACGNFNTGVQTITTHDITAPVITCPAPITISCNASQLPATTGTAIATDNCDPIPAITYTDVNIPGSGIGNSLITRTWKATDACGNFTTCMQLITVQDVTAPVITCPADITLNCNDLPIISITGTATAIDNCDPSPVITYSDVSVLGSCPGSAVITRKWTARDASGNISSCNQTITIHDITAPIISCPLNISINCQDSSDPTVTGTASATDNCDPAPAITFADVIIPGTCAGNHLISRTWTAKDACGNSSFCIQIITVQDITPPIITCPGNITISCSASSLPASTGVATASDGCDTDPVISSSDVITPGGCAGNFTIARTWRATDNCGNSSICVQTITVQDITPPDITSPADLIINCQSSTLPANTGTATATDNCGVNPAVTYTDVVAPGICTANYIITRTWSATDGCGNLGTVVQTITVRDISAPVITCPAPITINIEDSSLPSNTGTATAIDNCDLSPSISFVDVKTPGNCPGAFIITRSWSATDACHNTSSCDQVITIQDITPPVITCPANVTLNCQDPVLPANTGTATATDNSGLLPSITYTDASIQGGCTGDRTITRTWRATDGCGNFSTCNQIILIHDVIAPVITCPADITINCDAANSVATTGLATAIDACDPNPVIAYSDTNTPGSCAGKSVITRVWSATDACGNKSTCNQIITIQDNTAPILTLPANITINCDDSSLPAVTGSATATDNCDPTPTIGYSDLVAPGSCAGNYIISRTWNASDHCNNTTSSVQTITVQDNTPPSIDCPGPIMAECLSEVPAPDISLVSATDNCAGPITIAFVSDVSDGMTCPNFITRTYSAKDACGNISTCSQFIIIQDYTEPDLIGVPADITVDCKNIPTVTVVTATDNCIVAPVLTYSEVTIPGSCPGNYTLTRTWLATDNCGNSISESQDITVQDITPPAITCLVSGNQIVDTNSGNIYLHSNGSWDASATDACSSFTLTASLSGATTASALMTLNGVSFNSGVTTVTWNALDACGNPSSCSFTVTVNAGADLSITIAALPATVNLGQDLTYTIWVKNLGPSTASNVTVSEILPAGLTLSSFSSSLGVWDGVSTWSVGNLIFNDVATLTITAKTDLTHCFDYSNTVSVSSPTTDPNPVNNSATEITQVVDSTDPVITTCPVTRLIAGCSTSDITDPIFSAAGANSSYAEFSDVTNQGIAADNCGIISVTYQDVASGSAPIVVLRTWTLSDAAGNMSTCVQRIEVADTTPPTFTAPGPFIFCVENLSSASIISSKLKINPDPDFYLFKAGNTLLDLDPVTNNFNDNCCAVNTLVIHWRIDFTDTPNQIPPPPVLTHPSITGTGQPSVYGSDIQIPGDGVTFLSVVHTITYWLVDCNGNRSTDITVNITVNPRPKVN